MRRQPFFHSMLFFLGILLPALAATADPAIAPGSGCDIVILMDSSGSMKHTDPKNYRKDAAKLFVSLLGADDRVGIMSFGDNARLLSPLARNSPKNRKKLFRAIDRISSREFSTNITDAVRKGFQQLTVSHNTNKIMILMSDGRLALGSPEKDVAAFAELTRILPEVAKAGVKLYTVAFTDESDHPLLENMARVTGGFFRYARMDWDVHVMFTSIFEKIKSPDSVPFEGEAFSLDKDIQEATVLVTKKAGTAIALMDPAARKHAAAHHAKNMQWYQSNIFDMITVRKPAAGAWRVKLSANEGNKVFVVTNLNLKSSFAGSFVPRGKSLAIDAWLEKEGGMITEQDLLHSTTFSAELVEPGKPPRKLDLAPGSSAGAYAASLVPEAAGEYTVTIVASGKTFKREKIFQFKTEEPTAPVEPVPARAELKTLPSVSATPAHEDETVSWTSILIKFIMINAAFLAVAAAVYGGAVFYRKRTAHRNAAKPAKDKKQI